MRISFGAFCLDTERRLLTRGSEAVHLAPKAFDLLEILVRKRPEAVSRTALYDSLWPDTNVDEGSLHTLIYEIRAALGDHRKEIVRTVYGRGFAFDAPAVERDRRLPLQCQVVIGPAEIDLHEGENLIGRDRACAIFIDAPSISRRHARIVVTEDTALMEDLGSKNGTFLAGRRLRHPTPLTTGDRLLFGTVAAVFRILPNPPSTESEVV